VTIEEVLRSPMLCDPVKLLDMCPRSDGACAVIFASEEVAEKITEAPAWIWGATNRHCIPLSMMSISMGSILLKMHPENFTKNAGSREPLKEIDVIELYQPYSFGGLLWLESIRIV